MSGDEYRQQEWRRLLTALDDWTSAREVAPGRVEVGVPGRSEPVVIVMSPEEWTDLAGVMWGSFDDAFEDVKGSLLACGPDHPYAVYAEYRLHPSAAPELPAEDQVRPTGPGRWVARGRDGAEHYFDEWVEPGPD